MTAKKRSATKTKTKATAPKKTPAKAAAKKTATAGPKSRGTTTKTEKRVQLSALDAAAQLLVKSKEPLSCRQLIERMADEGLWKSPGGATPDRTLYSAMLREIATKGKDSRFVRVERGRFARRALGRQSGGRAPTRPRAPGPRRPAPPAPGGDRCARTPRTLSTHHPNEMRQSCHSEPVGKATCG